MSEQAAQAGAAQRTADAPRGSTQPLCHAYDVALLDLDGVVYIGGNAISGASQALRKASEEGMRLAYVTNNAFRTPAAVAQILTGFGLAVASGDVVTSAQAAARLLAQKLPAGSAVLVVGGMGLRLAVRERGLRPVSTSLDKPAAVVQGYAPGISYPLLAEGGLAVAAGALFVGTNADKTLPGPHGRQPGNGSLLQVITFATGQQPLIAGKPEPPLHEESVARTGARHPLVVGDRLDTDIEAAQRVKADSLLVLTGVTSPAEAVLAPPGPAAHLHRRGSVRPGRAAARGNVRGRRIQLRRLDGPLGGRQPARAVRPRHEDRWPARPVRRRLVPPPRPGRAHQRWPTAGPADSRLRGVSCSAQGGRLGGP